MSDRFPDVEWYCDECDAYLNEQVGFSDQGGSWMCADCGHQNGISADAILSDDDVARAVEFLSNFDPKNYSG